jgi:hypothetical protein
MLNVNIEVAQKENESRQFTFTLIPKDVVEGHFFVKKLKE